MRMLICFVLVTALVMACGTAVMGEASSYPTWKGSDITAFASFNPDEYGLTHLYGDDPDAVIKGRSAVGWDFGEVTKRENAVPNTDNPHYDPFRYSWPADPVESPGGTYNGWISERVLFHANMQLPVVVTGPCKWGSCVDTALQDGYASMGYYHVNANMEDRNPGGTGPAWWLVGTVNMIFPREEGGWDQGGAFEFYFKPHWNPQEEQPHARTIMELQEEWQLTLEDGQLTSTIRNDDGKPFSQDLGEGKDLIRDGWNHIALAWDSEEIATYMNGQKVGSSDHSNEMYWQYQLAFIGGGNNGLGGSAAAMEAAEGLYDAIIVWRNRGIFTGDTYTRPTAEIYPEPTTMSMLGLAAAALLVRRRRA